MARPYQAEEYDKAIQHFKSASSTDEGTFKGHYNLGNAQYKNNPSEAIESYKAASVQTDDRKQQAINSFNLGNAHLEAFSNNKNKCNSKCSPKCSK